MTKKTDPGRIPGPVAIANCIEVVLYWALVNARSGHDVLHGRNLGAFTPSVATAQSLYAAISSAWNSNLALYAPNTSTFQAITVRDMTATTNAFFQSSGAPVAGTSVSASMPPQIAMVMSARTASRGRGMNGRVYLPLWAANADAGNGQGITGLTAAVNAFGTAVYNAFTSAGLQPCVAKPARQAYTGIAGAAHPARSAGTVDVVNYVLRDLIWDTQRVRVKP